ncbi:8429_t:CDS:2 [Diversispora eburnea]|uniref:polynucleotide adenylyltransferase n=1 Tax=Diversispora eburnea TaxID=1213867 RepID=A0A9N8ZAF2_9GLOM|nr:8429_t:CDS:2 [Diversispora eburnea]
MQNVHTLNGLQVPANPYVDRSQPFYHQLPVNFRPFSISQPQRQVSATQSVHPSFLSEDTKEVESTNSSKRNESYIPLNPLTSEELKGFQRNFEEPKSKKRQRNASIDRWKKPLKTELPWLTEVSKIELHYEILELADYLKPTEVEHLLRAFVIKRIEIAIQKYIPTAEILAFGSFNTGLYLPTSDIDLVCFIHVQTPLALREVSRILVQENISLERPITLARAVVPIIKFREYYTTFNVDLSFNQASGFFSALSIKKFMREWPSLEKLVMVLKHFLRHHEIDDPSTGGMESLIPEDENLGVLLIEFFELYGLNFNYEKLAIRVKSSEGYGYFLKENESWAMKNPPTNLCIQDPTDEDNDISRSTRNMDYIREQFKCAFNRLVVRVGHLERNLPHDGKKFPGLQKESILSSILFVDHEIQKRRNKQAEDYNQHLAKVIEPFGNDASIFLTPIDFDYITSEFRLEIMSADKARMEKTAMTKHKFNRNRSYEGSSPINLRSQVPNYQSLVSRTEEDDRSSSKRHRYDITDSRNKRNSSSNNDNVRVYVENDSDMEMDSDYERSHRRSKSTRNKGSRNRRH